MSSAAYMMLATSSRPQSPRTPTQATAMSDEQMDLVEILRSGEDSRLRRHRLERSDTVALPSVALFCGADQDGEADWDEHRPWVLEILPETEPPPARKRQKRSNGCGARIHTRAKADRRWKGVLDGVSADVVALQDEYFTPDMKRELLLGQERCGCSRSGVGCAICGNPLGALFTPCARHSPSANTNFSTPHYTFLRAGVSPPLPHPTRRPSDDNITGRGEREALQRRIRDREEITQLRARMRAVQQQPQPPPRPLPRTGDPPESVPFLSAAALRRENRDRERRAREEHMAARVAELAAAGADDGRAFEAWADATLQRATATAAAADVGDVVVDLSPLMPVRGGSLADFVNPREFSEEERRRDWQLSVARTFGRDWPSMPRTIERTTAVPEPLPRHTLEEVLVMGRHASENRGAEDQEKEETTSTPRPRPFFER
ncbi:hypothetical protein B0H11DRAFT_2004680 [Mycena galericulata]|nr:hypothetical protein B0H11DRAFT_2004680 [Mycena galericulata]